MGRTKTGYRKREKERHEMAYRARHSRDAQEAEYAAQVWREREELLQQKDGKSAQADNLATGAIPTQAGASVLSAPLHIAQPDFDCDHSSGGIDIDMDDNFLPQALVHLDKQPNGGMPTFNLDDELIQRNETSFFNIPIGAALLFIIKAQEDRKHLDSTGGSKPLTPGRAFYLNAAEKEGRREARKARGIVESIEEHVIDRIKDLMVNPPVPEELEDEPESVYGDGDSDSSEDSNHKSGTDSGEDEVVDSDWLGKTDNQTSGIGPQKQPDEDLWEEQVLDADMVLQDALYFDIVVNAPTNAPLLPHTPLPHTHLAALTLFTQTDMSVEVDMGRGSKHPSGMVNRLGENDPDPFPTFRPLKRPSTRQPSKDEDMRCVTFMISLLMSMCFTYFKASHRLIAMLLWGFGLILKRLGHLEIADQLPHCVDTIYTCLEIDTTPFLILPICLKCKDVYPYDPTGHAICPRCNLGLYLPDPTPPEPKPQRRVRVPTYRLTLLLLSVQIEAFLNIEGAEVDVDQWRTTCPRKGVYTDVTKARVWNEIIDHEGKPFFWTEQVNGQHTGPGNEIRLGVHMAIDWYVIHLYFNCRHANALPGFPGFAATSQQVLHQPH